MGDRVAIIGGSTVGRDHFPFPVVDLTAEQIYPLGISLADAAKAFFLVKRWRIDVDVTVVGSGDPTADPPIPDTHLSQTYYADAGGAIEYHPTIIAQTPYASVSWLVTPTITLAVDFLGSNNFVIFCSETDGIFPAGKRMAFADGLFYPTLYCTCDDSVASVDDAFGSGPSGTTFDFMGYTMTMFGSADHVGTITVTPDEFWPYATKAGFPVYRTTDGVQLRDPFS